MGAVSSVFESVANVVGDIGSFVDDAVHDVGSFVDDAVNEVVPGGWATVAAVVTMNPELVGLDAATAAAAETAAAEGATGLASLGESVLPASEAFGAGAGTMATDAALAAGAGSSGTALGDMAISGLGEGAAAASEASPWGINPNPSTTEFGTFNPSTVSAPGIDASSLEGMEWLGGTGSLAEGTAGLTAEQLANATAAAQVGSNAASGLGYLGGAESLPSGTAGITGVTSDAVNWNDFSKSLGDLLNPNQAQNLANALHGGNVNVGGVNIPKSSQPAFSYTQQLPIQSGTSSSPTFLGELGNMQTQQKLANLLKG